MKTFVRIACSLLLLALVAGCARFEGTGMGQSQVSNRSASSNSLSATAPSEDFSKNQILSFLPAEAVAALSDTEKNEAASAQFFALQYGRVGAFREWAGKSENKGEVSVGPYIKVNQLDCREFTHVVFLNGIRLSKSGTSCREASGQWGVAAG